MKSPLHDAFERIVVINLDRRPDRLALVSAQAERLGFDLIRFPAVDGQDPEVAAAWRSYAQQPLAALPAGHRPVRTYREFYLDYESEIARIAFLEQKDGDKAIATPGAFGLLMSMTRIVERALAEGWESLLILEDDVIFHKDSDALFRLALAQLPYDWRILQLGAMQLHWEEDWIGWYGYNLYQCRGTSHGAHAVGLRRDVLPLLLERCKAIDLPFDIGALHTVKRRYADHCFTVFPNIAIQDASDTEIGMSRIFFDEVKKPSNRYRWHYPDYGLAAIERARASNSETEAAAALAALPRAEAQARRRWFGRVFEVKPAPAPPELAEKAEAPPKTAVVRPTYDLRPLRPFEADYPEAPRILALALGLEAEQMAKVARLLADQQRDTGIVPICVVDSDRFDVLRAARVAFEYLPSRRARSLASHDLDWDLYELRRLWLMRRKWQPSRIVAFGRLSVQTVHRWRQSPFEDASLLALTRSVMEGAGASPASTSSIEL